MPAYDSIYTGQEIDAAVGAVYDMLGESEASSSNIRNVLSFSIPTSSSKTITFTTPWNYVFLLVATAYTRAELNQAAYLISGYVSASRGRVTNLASNSNITIDMSSTSNSIVVNNNNTVGAITFSIIPLTNEASFSVS